MPQSYAQRVYQSFETSGLCWEDTLVKSGPGMIHTITFSCNDAAPTAGTIAILDDTEAGGSSTVYKENFTTTPFRGYTVTLDVAVSTGIYVDFTTTSDINVFVSYV